MDRGVALVLAIAVGGAVALQGPLNSTLGRAVGGLQAAIVAFIVGLAALLAIALVAGGLGGIADAGEAPWWALIGGGLLGALYVSSIIWTVRALGVGGLTAATIAGQFAVALVIDHFGWIGVERQPVTRETRRGGPRGGRDVAHRVGLADVAKLMRRFVHGRRCSTTTVLAWPSPTPGPAR